MGKEKTSLGESTIPAQVNIHVAKAHQVCPYSNAVLGNIDVTLEITTS